jgi:hypothetical protein
MVSGPRAARVRRGFWILLLGVALVIVNTWPLAPSLDRIGRVDSHDGQYGLWQSAWVARALVSDPFHVYDANIFYPHRSTLAFSEPTLLAGILGLPAYLATASPYATHNLAVLGFFLLSFLSAYALGWRLTGDALAATALAISFAFSPYVFARTAQLPMMAIFGLPLALLAMHGLVEAPSIRTAAGLAGALWLQALACGYYTIFALLIVGIGLVYFGIEGQRWRRHAFRLHAALSVALTAAVLLPLFWPHLRLSQAEGFRRPVGEALQFAADWRAWLASAAWAHRWMLTWLGTWNEVLFPGFIPSALGLAGAWLGLRGRLTLRSRHDSASVGHRAPDARALAGFYVLIGVFGAWCAFGPAGGLYALLYETLPLFAFIRASGRFGVLTTLAAGALMAMALAHFARDDARRRTIAGVVIVILAAELFSAPRPKVPAIRVSPVYLTLGSQPRGPVVEFPMFPRQLELNALYVLMSTAHWQPLVNGYGAFWPADIQQLAADTNSFPSEPAVERIRSWGVRYVVVHPRLYERHGLSTEADVLHRLDRLHAHLTLVASDPNVRLYQVSAPTLTKNEP